MSCGVLKMSGSKSTRLDALPLFGAGKKYSKAQYRTWINDLVLQGYLERTGDTYPVIGVGRKSEELLNGNCHVMLPFWI